MPPMNWERAVLGLMIRPTAKTPSIRVTRELAGVGVDAHLGELRAERVAASCSRRASKSSAVVVAAGLVAAARSSSAPAGLTTAVPHEAVPIEPPATGAGGRARVADLDATVERRRRARRRRSG